MGVARTRRQRPPLNARTLEELALVYVGRFATTRAKLRTYLARKVRERGWDDAAAPDVAAVAERCAALGYVDDAAYAVAKSRSLTGRGYGPRRVVQSLRAAGVADEDGSPARRLAGADAVEAIVHFAERRRIGPFAAAPADPRSREKALAALVRAGHDFGLARAVLDWPAGEPIDRDALQEYAPARRD